MLVLRVHGSTWPETSQKLHGVCVTISLFCFLCADRPGYSSDQSDIYSMRTVEVPSGLRNQNTRVEALGNELELLTLPAL